MKRFFILLPLLLGVAAQDTKTVDSVVESVLKEGKENSQVMTHLDHLTNKIGPRLTSSDNLTKACEWAKAQFESWGLKAKLEEWGTFPVGFNRGKQLGKMIEPEEKVLHPQCMSWTAGTKGEVVANAILAPPEADVEKSKDSLKGAWVLIDYRPGEAVTKIFDEAGIAGFVRGSREELVITSGNSRISWDKLPTRVTVHLPAAEYKSIADPLKAGKQVKLAFNIEAEFKQGPVKQYNVIADIPGTEKPDEFVIVGGHIDSWDGATGTTDNGTGTSTTMEAARLLAKAGAKPKRTIRFILWGGEEQGLHGSRGYVRDHKDEMPKISAVLVHDGGTNYVAGISATKPMVPLFEKVFAPIKDLNKDMPFTIQEVNGLRSGSSDHDSYLAAGVPGFFWHQRGKAVYRRTHHTQYDTFDAAIPEYQKHSSMVIAVGAYGIANLDALLPRDGMRAPGGDHPRAGGRRLGITPDENMTVTDVMPDGVAAKAGVKVGDKIVKVGGKAVSDPESLRTAMREGPAETTITVLREGKEVELKAKFDR
jgi:hypothetical protein